MNVRERLELSLQHCERMRHELLFSYGWIPAYAEVTRLMGSLA